MNPQFSSDGNLTWVNKLTDKCSAVAEELTVSFVRVEPQTIDDQLEAREAEKIMQNGVSRPSSNIIHW